MTHLLFNCHQELIHIINESPSGLTANEVAAKCGKKTQTAQSYLALLYKAGQIQRKREKKGRSSFRYYPINAQVDPDPNAKKLNTLTIAVPDKSSDLSGWSPVYSTPQEKALQALITIAKSGEANAINALKEIALSN